MSSPPSVFYFCKYCDKQSNKSGVQEVRRSGSKSSSSGKGLPNVINQICDYHKARIDEGQAGGHEQQKGKGSGKEKLPGFFDGMFRGKGKASSSKQPPRKENPDKKPNGMIAALYAANSRKSAHKKAKASARPAPPDGHDSDHD